MPKFPSLSPLKVQKILLKNGFIIKRQTGSHRIYYHPQSQKVVIIPFHNKDIAQGTIRSITKQADLNEDCFRKK